MERHELMNALHELANRCGRTHPRVAYVLRTLGVALDAREESSLAMTTWNWTRLAYERLPASNWSRDALFRLMQAGVDREP